MKFGAWFFILGGLAMVAVGSAHAQLLSPVPLCLTLDNQAGDEVLGQLETDQHIALDGAISQHQFTFRLAKNESRQFCSTGPFFDGYQLRLILKAAMPLYSCKTPMNRTVTITQGVDETGGKTLLADCPSERAALKARFPR